MCKSDLILRENANSKQSAILGEECHIRSPRTDGPRYESDYPISHLNSYKNLVLLCPTCHTQVDKQTDEYTTDRLLNIKEEHEQKVAAGLLESDNLYDREIPIEQVASDNPSTLQQICDSDDLMNILAGAYVYSFGHDDVNSKRDKVLISGFLKSAEEHAEIWLDLSASEKVEVGFYLDECLSELNQAGFILFGGRGCSTLRIGGTPTEWPIAYLQISRRDNPNVKKK